jgi:hypothetical protein
MLKFLKYLSLGIYIPDIDTKITDLCGLIIK